ncbi:hypothetical protein D3C75_762550 [compost metagenome]
MDTWIYQHCLAYKLKYSSKNKRFVCLKGSPDFNLVLPVMLVYPVQFEKDGAIQKIRAIGHNANAIKRQTAFKGKNSFIVIRKQPSFRETASGYCHTEKITRLWA